MAYESKLRSLHPTETEHREIGDATVAWHFSDADTEYAALRTHAALFDHGASGLLAITGDTGPFLAQVLARDVEYLGSERCMPSLLLDEDGTPYDLAVVYGLEDGVLLETSPGRRESTLAKLLSLAGPDVAITDLSEERAVIGVEGPYAWSTVGHVVDQELTALPFETVIETDWEGEPILFARSGFTGEYGYKIIAAIDVAARIWEALCQDAAPAGQGTLETAMLEVRQPVLHRELVDGGTVFSCGLNWLVDMSKDAFLGKDALESAWAAGTPGINVGFRTDGVVPVAGSAVFAGGIEIGTVVHAVSSPTLGGGFGLVRLDAELAGAGLVLDVVTDDGMAELTTLSSPYVVPTSWSVPIF